MSTYMTKVCQKQKNGEINLSLSVIFLPFHAHGVHRQRGKHIHLWEAESPPPASTKMLQVWKGQANFPASGIYFLIKDYQQPTACWEPQSSLGNQETEKILSALYSVQKYLSVTLY